MNASYESALIRWAEQTLGARLCKRGWSAFKCKIPSHRDNNASAAICLDPTKPNFGQIKCLGCDRTWWPDQYAAECGLEAPPVKPREDSKTKTPSGRTKQAEYPYPPHLKVVRYLEPGGNKTFRPFHLKNGKWKIGAGGLPYPLYHRESILKYPGELVLFVEGEKDVHTAERLGFVATTTPHGADGIGKVEDWSALDGRQVVVIPDNDQAGESYARKLSQKLSDVAAYVRVLRLDSLQEKGDLSDWVQQGGNREQLLVRIANEAEPFSEADTSVETRLRDDWPPIQLVKQSERLEFPLDIYPSWCRHYLAAIAKHLQVPTCFPGMLFLGQLAIILQGRFRVKVTAFWMEVLALWILLSGPSGSRKSPAFSKVFEPIGIWSANVKKVFGQERKRIHRRIRSLESEIDSLKKRKAKPELIEAKERELDDLFVPPIPKLFTGTATTQAFEQNLPLHHGRAAFANAESDVRSFFKGKHKGEAPTETAMSGWSGEAARSDYATKDDIDQEAIFFSMAICTQPENTQKLYADEELRGRGVLGRFLPCAPHCEIHEELIDTELDPSLFSSYRDGLLRLLPSMSELFEVYLGRSTNMDGSEGAVETGWTCEELVLSDEAKALLRRFYARCQRRRKPGGDLQFLEEFAPKYCGQVLRIAGLLHLCDHPEGAPPEISLCALGRAIRLGDEYLIPHAKAVYGQSDVARVEKVWSVLRDLGPEVSRRDIQQAVRPLPAAELDSALEVLESRGFLRLETAPNPERKRGRRPKKIRLNPKAPQTICQTNSRSANSQTASRSVRPARVADPIDPLDHLADTPPSELF